MQQITLKEVVEMGKSLQDIYDEVVANESLVKEFIKAEKEEKLEEFVKTLGCSATAEEIKSFVESKMQAARELSPEELDAVAGGKQDVPNAPQTTPTPVVVVIPKQ